MPSLWTLLAVSLVSSGLYAATMFLVGFIGAVRDAAADEAPPLGEIERPPTEGNM